MAASSEDDIYLGVGFISSDLEEDVEEEVINIFNGEYDAVGAGGSENEDTTELNQTYKKNNPYLPPIEFLSESIQTSSILYKQYWLSLQKSSISYPFYILYCCSIDAFLL